MKTAALKTTNLTDLDAVDTKRGVPPPGHESLGLVTFVNQLGRADIPLEVIHVEGDSLVHLQLFVSDRSNGVHEALHQNTDKCKS